MRRSGIAALAVGVLAVSGWTVQQGIRAESPMASSQRAFALVEESIAAIGGVDALRSAGVIYRELAGVRTDAGQGSVPVTLSPTYAGIGTPPPKTAQPMQVSVRDPGTGRALEYFRDAIAGGQPLERRQYARVDSAAVVYYDYIYHAARSIPVPALPQTRANLFRRYPENFLLAAYDRREMLRYVGAATYDGRPHEVISFADPVGVLLTIYLDARTHFPSKTEGTQDDPVMGDIVSELVFTDWKHAGKLLLPHRVVERNGGVTLQDSRVTKITIGTPVADSLFQVPAGFPLVNVAAAQNEVRELSDGIYALLGNYNSLFAVFDDYVVVVEAGSSTGDASAMIRKIHATAPGKPIRYVIPTHFHWDHLSGIRAYIAEGATILTLPNARKVIEEIARAPHKLRPDTLSRAPRTPVFEAFTGKKRVFTDGKRTLEIHDFSPTPHVQEMLVAWVPQAGALYEADSFDNVVPGHVGTGGQDTADLLSKVQGRGFDVKTIVPVHGWPATMDDLRASLARRKN